ncbi:MAG: V-type ATP synthase subunit E [Spirochaetes bacterium]|nr:V-type ATP synthase subunit E [Spirochaetota bacterium]
MDIRLQELLDRIKKEGVDEANAAAAAIAEESETRKKSILDAAEREARAIIEKARTDAARFEEAGNAALGQASRNLVLAFRGEVEKILSAVVSAEVVKAFDETVLGIAIPAVLAAWKEKNIDDLAVLLPPDTLKRIESHFRDKLGAELRKGLELKPFPGLKSGFRITEKNGAAYYDFSAEAVSALFCQYLNGKLAAIVDAAGKGA